MIQHNVPGWYSSVRARQEHCCKIRSLVERHYAEVLGYCSDDFKIDRVALDLNGTITIDGELIPGVIPWLLKCSEHQLLISILTGNVRGNAAEIQQLLIDQGIDVELVDCRQSQEGTAVAKENWMKAHPNTAFIGNGNGDALAAGSATLSIGVCQREGLGGLLVGACDVYCNNIGDAFALILEPAKLRATCHF